MFGSIGGVLGEHGVEVGGEVLCWRVDGCEGIEGGFITKELDTRCYKGLCDFWPYGRKNGRMDY